MPKSSSEKLMPRRMQVPQVGERGLAVLEHHALGQLDLQEARLEAGLGKRGLDQVTTVLSRNWIGERLTDRRKRRHPGMPPEPLLAAGPREHALGQRRDQADVLGEADELGRPDHAAPRMAPAQQRLHADDPAGR